MSRSDEEIDAIWQREGKAGAQNIINSQHIVDKRDVARLRQKIQDEEEREESERLSRQERREEQTLRIAEEANSIARAASVEARSARLAVKYDRAIAITAIIIAAISAREDIHWLISEILK